MKFKAEGATVQVELLPSPHGPGMAILRVNGTTLHHTTREVAGMHYLSLRDVLRSACVSLVEQGEATVVVPKDRSGGNGLITAQRSYITDIADNPPEVIPYVVDGKTVGYHIDVEQRTGAMRNYLPPDQRTPSWREIGVRYGYPVCCIDSFVRLEHIKHPQPLKLDGTGYIPCKSCNERYSEQGMARRINARRYKCLKPFTTNRMDHIVCEEG